MDPVTAFSLAAGILQVISVSSEAIILCRRLYKDGSLGEYDKMTDITAKLVQGTDRLNAATLTAKPRSRDDQEVLDLSQKCSDLGKELLRDLDKLKLEKGRLRQAILKSVRAHRQKAAIKEKQDLLNKYQRVLDTRILGRLDARSLKETQDVRCLDQSVQQLVHELEQGNSTVAQLLSNHKEILDRIEGKLESNPRTTANQQLLDSLFFPEIDSREDHIQDAFDGTCHWILDSATDDTRKPWSNFRKWLETENGVYWISGKPGAGKSTLMKYIVREDLTSQLLANWERGTDLLVVTFFFWHTGSTLQKSLEGLLRSLLYQIADQWPGLVGYLDAHKGKRSGETEVSGTLRLQKWTEQRLLALLKRFLEQKPASITICAFVDGLDEFTGDEDILLNIIRFFSKAPHCKICVSSRPEQVFRDEFQLCPKLRVQDLNRQDMERMINQRLLPRLPTHRSTWQDSYGLRLMVESLVEKSSGVFLWLDLVIKDMIQGFRNEDTFDELQSRIDRTPDTVYGMYARSLTNSGPGYLETALKYLRVILTAEEVGTRNTLLSLALTEPEPWEVITRYELEYFTSPRFRSTCEALEVRLVSRCGSLLEIDDNEDGGGLNCDPLVYYDRSIQFMHKTAVEFLREEYKTFFLDEAISAEAAAQVARSKIGYIVLFELMQRDMTHNRYRLKGFSKALRLVGYFSRASGMEESFQAIQVNLIRHAIGWIQRLHKECTHSWKRGFSFWEFLLVFLDADPWSENEVSMDLTVTPWDPIVDDLSIAAYFGCHLYFQFLVSSEVCSVERMSTMLHAAQSGIEYAIEFEESSFAVSAAGFTIVQEILKNHVNPNAILCMKPSRFRHIQHASLWARVLVSLLEATRFGPEQNTTIYMAWESWEASCTNLIERLLNLGADPNTRITFCYRYEFEGKEARIYVEESPLAVWNRLDRTQRLARIEARLRLAGGKSYRRFQFLCLEGSLYPISSSQSHDVADIMSFRLETAAGASSWAWEFWPLPWIELDGELGKALVDLIQSIAAERPLEREAAMTSLPPGVGNEVLFETYRLSEGGDDEDDKLSQSSYVSSEAPLRDSKGSFQGPEP
ncbi:MAG: hypothetical protein Q9178_006454 [Gyalolechia marmorata]